MPISSTLPKAKVAIGRARITRSTHGAESRHAPQARYAGRGSHLAEAEYEDEDAESDQRHDGDHLDQREPELELAEDLDGNQVDPERTIKVISPGTTAAPLETSTARDADSRISAMPTTTQRNQ